jgi:hypothetical protein
LKKAIPFILMFVALSSVSFAAGHGPIVVDIVGSNTEDTRIDAPAAGSVDLEIVGSNARNTVISTKVEKAGFSCCCWPYYCPQASCNYSQPCTVTQTSGQHLGVDAWYGTFWYTPYNHLPKWPQA